MCLWSTCRIKLKESNLERNIPRGIKLWYIVSINHMEIMAILPRTSTKMITHFRRSPVGFCPPRPG